MFFKLHNIRSILGHKLHYLGTAALGIGALAIAQPWMIIAGAGLMTAGVGLAIKLNKHVIENRLQEHPDNHKFSPNLKSMTQALYKISGLDPLKAAVYNFKTKKTRSQDKGKFKEIFEEAFDEIAKVPNAAAFNMGKPVIMISEPLLELLDDPEEYAVLAHEFTHAAAKHQHVSLPHSLLSGVIKTSGALARITEALSTGVIGIGVSIASVTALHLAVRKHHPKGHLLKTKNKDLPEFLQEEETLPELHEKKSLKKYLKYATTAVATGVLTAFNPLYLPIFAATKGISLAASFLQKSFSRSNEYQADTGATVLGASPLALITSLRKMSAVQKRSLKKAWAPHAVPEKNALSRAWSEQFSTHPSINKRINRLVTIAQKQGYSPDEIKKATTGSLVIPDTVNIPNDQIVAMAKSFIGSSAYEGINDNQVKGNTTPNNVVTSFIGPPKTLMENRI